MNDRIKSYDEIIDFLDDEIKKLDEKMFMQQAAEEWDKFIPGLKRIELNEKGEVISFTAVSKAKDFHNH